MEKLKLNKSKTERAVVDGKPFALSEDLTHIFYDGAWVPLRWDDKAGRGELTTARGVFQVSIQPIEQ